MNKPQRLVSGICIRLIRGYQLIFSPLLGSNCRFYPTCSAFAIEAIRQHGVIRGVFLSLSRLARCHPFGPAWKYDPVPQVCCRSNTKPSQHEGSGGQASN